MDLRRGVPSHLRVLQFLGLKSEVRGPTSCFSPSPKLSLARDRNWRHNPHEHCSVTGDNAWTMILPTSHIQFVELPNKSDARGYSFTVPPQALKYVGKAADVHLASTEPAAVRGNHYHVNSLMAIVVLPGSKWSFHWDEGSDTQLQHRTFEGDAAVLILVAPGASHAVRNDGEKILWVASISSETYDAADRVERRVV